MLEVILMCLAAGMLAGLLAGLFGVGGGLVIVPVLVTVFALQQFDPTVHMQLALGSSLATIVVTGMSSTWAHQRKQAVDWGVFKRIALPLAAGAALGAVIADWIPSMNLKLAFGIGEILVAINMLRPKAVSQTTGSGITTPKLVSGGGVIGVLAALAGIGGGTFTVPFFSWCGMIMQRAVATSAACGLPIAIAGALSYIVSGYSNAALPDGATGYVYWPAVLGIVSASVLMAPLGAKLSHRLPPEKLKLAFAGLLALLGLKMLFF